MAYQIAVVAAVYCAVHTIGLTIPNAAVIAFVPAVAMAQVVPISVGGLGVREGMLALLLHPLGVETGQAVAVGLLWYAMTLIVSLLGAPAFAIGHRDAEPRRGPAGPRRRRRIVTVATEDARPFFRRLPGARVLRGGAVLYWWAEIIFVAVFYVVYSAIRNSNEGGTGVARENAFELMRWQEFLGINNERAVQEWALNFRPLILASNYFYGSLHFIVTAGVMIFLYRKFSDEYPIWRNTLAIATAIALDRLHVLAADAAAAASGQLRLRRHGRQVSGVLVVQPRGREQDLQPVRRHAQRPLRVGVVVCHGARAAPPATVGKGASQGSTRSAP